MEEAPPPQRPHGLELPEEVLALLPDDPFEQLDLARKITSIALANRVSALESEIGSLRAELDEKDDFVADLQAQVEALDSTVADMSNQLARAEAEKEALKTENATLASTVKKLNRDVSKLEIFRKTLMQSLQEEDEGSKTGSPQTAIKQMTSSSGLSSGSHLGDEEVAMPALKLRTQLSETATASSDDISSSESDASSRGLSGFLFLPSRGGTPRLTPPMSPRKHSMSFSTTRNAFEERTAVLSSLPSSQHSSLSGSLNSVSQPERVRVDGKEFFRQVRSRLSYEQFSAFLENVKDMNARKQTREETLRKADEIFGSDNRDLYVIFEGLVTRNLQYSNSTPSVH